MLGSFQTSVFYSQFHYNVLCVKLVAVVANTCGAKVEWLKM
jgi:hypothetical protein